MNFKLFFLLSLLFGINNTYLNAQQKKISHKVGIKAGIGYNGRVFIGEGVYHFNYNPTRKIWLGIETGVTRSYWFRLRLIGGRVRPHYSFNLGTQLGFTFLRKHRIFSRLGFIFESIHGPMFQYGLGYSIKRKKSEFQLLLNRDIAQDLYNPKTRGAIGDTLNFRNYFSVSITYLKEFQFRF